MSEYKYIKVEKSDGRWDIVLNCPPLNILTIAMMGEICEAVEEAVGDPSLKALLFRAVGKHFSAGADVAEHTADRVNEMIDVFGRMFRRMSKVSAVTIAAVQGSALGGGCELATFCDIVLADEQAKFGQPEIQLGVFPPVAVVIFPHLIGRNRAIELLITGKVIKAEEAERIGLVNHIYPADQFLAKVGEFIAGFTNLSASSIAVTKRAIDRAMYPPAMEGLRLTEESYFSELMTTYDANEGLAAFLERRRPEWKDR
ncbi:MAG: enoyl-CoA hydratase/isomerase family protein [candidate division Zixibacteria bacterium]|nr:enoyl-CoA hydratase/isomerase family protein [Candidatus Tariuqbacter arcticus]